MVASKNHLYCWLEWGRYGRHTTHFYSRNRTPSFEIGTTFGVYTFPFCHAKSIPPDLFYLFISIQDLLHLTPS
jgi:hypothetical protein